jgi:protein SCO1/2/putative membrane protein
MIVAEEVNPKPGFEIMHSITIMHVNAEGRVMGQYNARNDVDMARLRRKLVGKSDAADSQMIAKADQEDAARAAEQRRLKEEAERAARQTEARGDASPPLPGVAPEWVYRLPAVNASLNGIATVLLVTGWILVKLRRLKAHEIAMLSTFVTSSLFLGVYLLYHFALGYYTGATSKRFEGSGAIRGVYLSILVTHVLLAAAVPFLAGTTIWRAVTGQWEKHKSLARITFPIWLYVSVTGVIIYFMLYHWPQG